MNTSTATMIIEILQLLSNLTDEQLNSLDDQKFAEALLYIHNAHDPHRTNF